ncbi:hypothetical protein FQA47_022663, partial [Oryzias melastigma]
ETTFQAVLISGGQKSFVLMNYGVIASTFQNVQAGYDTINSVHHFTIPGSFSSSATGSNSIFRFNSNVNVTGRWGFETYSRPENQQCLFFSFLAYFYPISGTESSRSLDGSSPEIPLQRPFVYFGKEYNTIYAGYDTINSVHHFTIPGSFSSSATGSNSTFSLSSNVNVAGRWAFETNMTFFSFLAYFYPISGTESSRSDDGSSPKIPLQRPFVYFGKEYNTIYAGYDTINSVHHFTIPGSFSSSATGINSTFSLSSNVNVTGRWAFDIDSGPEDQVIKEYIMTLKVGIKPSSLNASQIEELVKEDASVTMLLPVLLLVLVGHTLASHFYGTVMTYYPKETQVDGSITVVVRFKMSYHSCLNLDSWICSGNCGNKNVTLHQIQTVSNENWCQEEGIMTRVLPNNTEFSLRFSGGDWIKDIINNVVSWSAVTQVELRNRSDTGKANISPQTTNLPSLRVPSNCPRDYNLLAFDPDGDEVKCRYGNSSEECANCNTSSVLTLSPWIQLYRLVPKESIYQNFCLQLHQTELN